MKAFWAEKYLNEKNVELVFSCNKTIYGDSSINIYTSATFELAINGKVVLVGPKRVAEGFVCKNSFQFTANGETQIVIRAVHYGITGYSHFNQAPFFAVELVNGGKVVAKTSDFSCARNLARVQRVERYSCQRTFLEYYSYKSDKTYFDEDCLERLDLIEVKMPKTISNEAFLPTLELLEIDNRIDEGEIYLKKEFFDEIIPPYARVTSSASGYFDNELEARVSSEASQMGFESKKLTGETLVENGYILYQLPVEKTGYFRLDVTAFSDCEIFYIFDEIIPSVEELKSLPGGEFFAGDKYPVAFNRFTAVNALKYKLAKGNYSLSSIEPYSFKFVRLCVKGKAKINSFGLALCENDADKGFVLKTDNDKVKAVVDSAVNTFKQNVLDIFMDCPSRERAGWLCDSFFIARAENFITGKNLTERAFLNNYLIAPPSQNLPAEMFPMCYPATFLSGNYIPNWAMWLIIELKDYYLRTGDLQLPIEFKSKVCNLLSFFERYENEYGLLESLDKWIFVEWSDSNKYVRDVNYPTNMLYSYALKTAGELYGISEYLTKAENIKREIIKQAFNGEFFYDHAKRENGVLVVKPQITETCQYYAIFFEIAKGDGFNGFIQKMFNEFGVDKGTHQGVSPSNAFIGNFLRLECLSRYGLNERVYSECISAFLYMANRTGTLWENVTPSASCNHGFASYAANLLVRACTGFVGFNVREKKLLFRMDFCCKDNLLVKMPLQSGSVTVEVVCGERKITCNEYQIEYVNA